MTNVIFRCEAPHGPGFVTKQLTNSLTRSLTRLHFASFNEASPVHLRNFSIIQNVMIGLINRWGISSARHFILQQNKTSNCTWRPERELQHSTPVKLTHHHHTATTSEQRVRWHDTSTFRNPVIKGAVHLEPLLSKYQTPDIKTGVLSFTERWLQCVGRFFLDSRSHLTFTRNI